MTPIETPCSRKYRAVHSSGTRDTKIIKWIVLHDEEASTAESAASWFENPDSGGSAHLCVDDTICYRTLNNEDIPWGAASSFGANQYGFHIEQAGFAKWSLVLWQSHRLTLQRAAYKTALHCKLFNIPPYFVKADELLAGKKGVTTHAEVSAASRKQDPAHASDYTHSDPGPLFPRFYFMRLVRGYLDQLGGV